MKTRRKETLLMIIFALILTIITISIAVLALTPKSTTINTTTNQTLNNITPTETTPNNYYAAQTNPPVEYDEDAQQRLIDKIEHHPALSISDQQARQKLLTNIGNTSGVLYQSPLVEIDYLQSGDFFQAQILNIDINSAKDEANIWLRNQGLSQQGICNLPLQFFLNWNIASQLRNSHITFNPLPKSC